MELGSEYNLSLSKLECVDNNLFSYLMDYNCVFTDSGRSALKLAAQKVKHVLLPEFVCESVIKCFKKENIRFYNITKNGEIDLEDLLSKIDSSTDAILLMHYFGVLQPEEILHEIKRVADQNKIIVLEDTTHSLLSAKRTIGDYMIASVRKWMPIPHGGVLYSKKELPSVEGIKKSSDNIRLYGMILKDLHLKGILECNETYRNIFKECEESLDKKEGIELISDVSKFVISCIDIKHIKDTRKSNYKYLLSCFKNNKIDSVCELKENDCPFVFPVRVPDRDRFRKYLIDHGVYCAVHWPFENCKAYERKMAVMNAETLISLPIDQRYGERDMDYMVNVIEGYGGELSF